MMDLLTLTLRRPLSAWEALRRRGLTAADGWSLIMCTAALAAILSWLGARMLPGSAEAAGVLAALALQPFAMAGVQVASAALAAFLLFEVGRIFKGTGSFADALVAVGWIEAVMVGLQALQLAATLVVPPLGALIGIGTLLVAAFLVIAFTMAVHGFRNPLLVLLGIIGTVMLTSFLLSMTAAMFGLLPGVPA